MQQWHNQTVFVTGGTGMVGRHVLDIGQRMGANLHVLARSSDDKKVPPSNSPRQHGEDRLRVDTNHFPSEVMYHSADIQDEIALKAIIDDIQPTAIIHLAASGVGYDSGTPSEITHTNVIGLQNLLEATRTLDSRPPIVIADTGFVYAPQNRPMREDDLIQPFNPYAASKAAAAEIARFYATQLPITILRLFSLYSPYEKLPRLLPHIVHTARNGDPIDLTACEQIRDYAYAGDIGEIFWQALSLNPSPLEIINIGSGNAITLRHFVETIGEILKENGITPKFDFGARPYRQNELMTYLPDIEKMQSKLTPSTPTDLKVGLRISVEGILEQIG